MKQLFAVLLLAALAAGGWYYVAGRNGAVPVYQTATIQRGDLTQAVTATGTLNPVLNVQVGSQISGNIQKLFVDFNSPVKEGEVIAQLDPAVYQAAVHQAEGDLANSRAALELAQVNEKRARELGEKKISSQSDLDAATGALHQAEATLKVKQAQLERAKVDLDHCTIYAPIDGVIISRNVDVGQTVAASLQAPIIFTIANDLRKMQIDANVAEADVGNVAVGQGVDFSVDAFPYRTFHGEVAQVRNAPITVQNVVTYDTVISVTNEELKLKPGMTANVSVVIAQRQNVLKLPNSALRFRPPDAPKPSPSPATPGGEKRGGGAGRQRERGGPSERTIYQLAGGKPEPVSVKLGISDGIVTELLDGLPENAVVVTGVTLPQSSAPTQPGGSPFGGARRGM